MSPPLALVTGATGAVGPALVDRLLESGYAVRALVRREPPAGLLPEEVEYVNGDITEKATLGRAFEGADVAFHLAANLHRNTVGKSLEEAYRAVNVQGTVNVAEAAESAGVSRLVVFSTISVYGTRHGSEPIDEAVVPEPDTVYGETKLEGSRLALAIHPGATVLRLAAVYGPRMRGNYPRLVSMVRRGLPVIVGDGSNRRTIVHSEDAARMAVRVSEKPETSGNVYNVTDGHFYTLLEIVHAIQAAAARKRRALHLPLLPMKLTAVAAEALCGALGREAPFSRAMIDKMTEDVAVSGERLHSSLGYQPIHDLRSGWETALAEMQPIAA